jgi:NAD(P)-dependent dehydrogenase (short-subunit alcohol dehydrogenase family)
MPQSGPIAIVTGASRGAGRGIAAALGSHGCTVYVTGRSEKSGDAALPGTIHETAAAITAAGGKGIAVRVDHADDAQVKALFDRVHSEAGGLDILVNNAAAVRDELTAPGNFWEKPLAMANMISVGVRSSYVASYYGVPLMFDRPRGLLIFTSSSGSVHYCLGPAYGAHKAGQDKLAADMAVDLQGRNVAAISIWMGALMTERMARLIADHREKYGHLEAMLETPDLTGHVIWGLYRDPALLQMSGQTVIGAEMAMKYGIKDAGGRQPPSCRGVNGEPRLQHPKIIR